MAAPSRLDAQPSRRNVLGGAACIGLSAACKSPGDSAASAAAPLSGLRPEDGAGWAQIAALYDRPADCINLEHGNWGAMARPVREAYMAHTERVNRDMSYYSRRLFAEDERRVRGEVASLLGIEHEEISFTRGATEALKSLIGGYNRLSTGDGLLVCDLDYDSMIDSMASRARQIGGTLVSIAIPEAATADEILATYTDAFDQHPEIRLVLVTHLSHRSGLVMPVREIISLARSRGADTIVDAAHSLGQVPVDLADWNADFAGFNLHKWIGAPLGVGVIYIRAHRLADISPDIAAGAWERDLISGRVHPGTINFAATLAVSDALSLQRQIGAQAKFARLRYLRDSWVRQVRVLAGLTILTPDIPGAYGAITSFRLTGQGSPEANIALARRLLDEFGIFTVHRTGPARGACIRITPNLSTTDGEIESLVRAIRAIAA